MGLWRSSGRPSRMKTMPSGPVMPRSPCRRPSAATAQEVRRGHGLEVQIRVGLNAGEVVVRAIGNDLHMDYSAIGQTTHLAARMEQLAPPGSIRLTADTLRLAEGWVQIIPLGPGAVKGLPTPVEVCELVDAGHGSHAPAGVCGAGADPLCRAAGGTGGPAQALEQAGAGHGQMMAVIGEAGVGKTRLFHEFTHVSRTQGWLVLESSSTSYGKATPYLPVIDLLKAYFQLEDRDDGRRRREKITGRLLTLEPALADPAGIPGPPGGAGRRCPMAGPRSNATPPAHTGRPQTLDAARKPGATPRCWSSRTCTGSMRRPRRSSIAWWRAYPPPASSCWSTTARSISTAGALKPPTRSSGSTRYRRQALRACSRASSGTMPVWTAQTALDRAHAGEPLLPGRERADPGGNTGAGR